MRLNYKVKTLKHLNVFHAILRISPTCSLDLSSQHRIDSNTCKFIVFDLNSKVYIIYSFTLPLHTSKQITMLRPGVVAPIGIPSVFVMVYKHLHILCHVPHL